jgi:predicted O-methyltransferase YrrM
MKKTTKTTTIQKIKDHAIANQIPIIQDEVAKVLKILIETYDVKKVLEIGTATSYSAHVMASCGSEVWTIERNALRYSIAEDFVKNSEYQHKIHLIFDDALTHTLKENHFDLIFIDAAKSQYIPFFEKYQHYLNPKGIMIVDNIFFHHLDPLKVKRPTRQLLKKIEKFKLFLSVHPNFQSQILSYGDGLSISYQDHDRYIEMQSIIESTLQKW